MTFRAILAAALVALAIPSVVSADETSRAANQLLAAQITDSLTTRLIITHGGYEADPLARPFIHSTASALGSAIAFNLLARTIFSRDPAVLRVLAGVEQSATAENLYQMTRPWYGASAPTSLPLASKGCALAPQNCHPI